VLLTFS